MPVVIPRFGEIASYRGYQSTALLAVLEGRPMSGRAPYSNQHGTDTWLLRFWIGRETGEFVQSLYDADYWRQRAEDARAAAQSMTLPAAKREMHFIAQAYEHLADHAERTAGRRGSRQAP